MSEWEWVVANRVFVADVILGLLNLGLLSMVFVESRMTRNITRRLTAIEEARDQATLELDAIAESKMFKPEDGDIWVFIRIANRGGRDSVLWPSKCGVFGPDENGVEVRLPFEIWATQELLNQHMVNRSELRATLEATPGAQRRRDPEAYNVRAGQMREFFVRVFAQEPLDSTRGDEVRVALAPVLGDPISRSVKLHTLGEARDYLLSQGR